MKGAVDSNGYTDCYVPCLTRVERKPRIHKSCGVPRIQDDHFTDFLRILHISFLRTTVQPVNRDQPMSGAPGCWNMLLMSYGPPIAGRGSIKNLYTSPWCNQRLKKYIILQ